MRRVVVLVGAAVVGVGLAVMTAGPARAALIGSPAWNGTTLSGSNLSGVVNDTYTFTNTGGSTLYLVNNTGTASVGASSCAVTMPATSLCSVTNGATVTVTVTGLGTITVYEGVLSKGDITVTAGGSGGGSSSSSVAAPSPIVQQFARPVSGTCDAAQPSGLDWAGVASGGWSESWAEWANGGVGGAVCTRTLEYSGGWRIAS